LRVLQNILRYTISDDDNVLSIMYWMPKIYKIPMGHRIIVASKIRCTKKL
jgi:hypothetical protein